MTSTTNHVAWVLNASNAELLSLDAQHDVLVKLHRVHRRGLHHSQGIHFPVVERLLEVTHEPEVRSLSSGHGQGVSTVGAIEIVLRGEHDTGGRHQLVQVLAGEDVVRLDIRVRRVHRRRSGLGSRSRQSRVLRRSHTTGTLTDTGRVEDMASIMQVARHHEDRVRVNVEWFPGVRVNHFVERLLNHVQVRPTHERTRVEVITPTATSEIRRVR